MIVFQTGGGEIHGSIDPDSPSVCGSGDRPLWSVSRYEVDSARAAAGGVICKACRAWFLERARQEAPDPPGEASK